MGFMERDKFLNEYEHHQKNDQERKKIIGDRLLWLRREAGCSQRQLSDIVGVTPQTYSGYESGKYEPSIESLIRLCFIYSVDMDFITGRWVDVDENLDSKNEVDNIPGNSTIEKIMVRLHSLEKSMESFKKIQKESEDNK